MSETGTCARCGTRIPGAGVQGLCPACLAQVAFAPETILVDNRVLLRRPPEQRSITSATTSCWKKSHAAAWGWSIRRDR